MLESLLRIRGPETGMQLQDSKSGHRIARIIRPTQHRHHVLHVRRFQEFESAIFHKRNVLLGELDLQHIAVVRAAKQNRVPLQGAADLARMQNLAADVFGLRLRIVQCHVEGLVRRLARAQQRFAVLAGAIGHQGVGAIQHLLRRAIILRQHYHVGLRLVSIGEAENVLHGSSAKRINGLSIIAHHRDAFAIGLERVNDVALQAAGVLVFIDQNMVEIFGQALRQCGCLHHHMPVKQQVIEIQAAVFLLAADVFAIQLGQVRLPFEAPRELLLEGLLQRQPGIDPIRINREAGVLARKALRSARKAQFAANDIHEIRGVGAIQDREIWIKAKMLGVEP